MEDEKIVQLIWDRNENGIYELSEKYDRYCFCISERIVHDEEDAKECVNDTWQGHGIRFRQADRQCLVHFLPR